MRTSSKFVLILALGGLTSCQGGTDINTNATQALQVFCQAHGKGLIPLNPTQMQAATTLCKAIGMGVEP